MDRSCGLKWTYETLDNRVGHGVSIKEFGLGLSAVATLSVPPTTTVSIESGTGAIDGERVAGDGYQRTSPFFVSKSCGTFEDDVRSLGKLGQVESGTSGDNEAVKSDRRA